jgi:hypothetical protein
LDNSGARSARTTLRSTMLVGGWSGGWGGRGV